MNVWPDWLKVIQLQPRFLFGLWVFGALLLFLPTHPATALGVVAIRDHYRPWIGLGTLGAFAFWIVQLLPVMARRLLSSKYQATVLKNLSGLTREERFQLAYCIYRGQRTLYLRITDSAAQSLCNKGLFEVSTGQGSMLAWPFSIPLFVWEFIRANPHTILAQSEWGRPELLGAFVRFEEDMQRNQY
jgi:Super-infection exclusion protein B